jgi:hypothetical protein
MQTSTIVVVTALHSLLELLFVYPGVQVPTASLLHLALLFYWLAVIQAAQF